MLITIRGGIYPTVSHSTFLLRLLAVIKADFTVASDVCRDLVLYDSPKHNPFRELIPLAHQSSALLQVIIANAALHMSNACHKSLVLKTATPPPRHHTSTKGSPRSKSCATQSPGPYKDALAAKQRALHLLKSALADLASTDIDATLAVVLLLVDFELIDSGQDNWRHHINGARTIIEICLGSNATTCTAMSPLRSSLISNYLVYVGSFDSQYVSHRR